MVLHGWVARKQEASLLCRKGRVCLFVFFQKILILQRGELVWTVAGLLVMPKVSDS